ncbi:unnamed protein product [Ixodes hexagonus]
MRHSAGSQTNDNLQQLTGKKRQLHTGSCGMTATDDLS